MRLYAGIAIIVFGLLLAASPARAQVDVSTLYNLAQRGSPTAQYSLGLMLQKGEHGVREDHNKAVMWYQRAAEQGHRQAQSSLALLLLQEPTLKGGVPTAYYWLLVLQREGDKDAAGLVPDVEKMLPPDQASAIQSRAKRWTPKPEKIPIAPEKKKKFIEVPVPQH